jgi:hypothetical protein
MRSLLSRRPSPAMAVALTALFVSLGGIGYAASTVPDNSVGTRQLKDAAVTAAKLRAPRTPPRRPSAGIRWGWSA